MERGKTAEGFVFPEQRHSTASYNQDSLFTGEKTTSKIRGWRKSVGKKRKTRLPLCVRGFMSVFAVFAWPPPKIIFYYYMAMPVLGKSERSDWFFLGRDFAVRTFSVETVQFVYFCFEQSRQIQNLQPKLSGT